VGCWGAARPLRQHDAAEGDRGAQPSQAATTGWTRTTTEAVEVGSRPMAQAMEPCPATCIRPSPTQAPHPASVAGRIGSPMASAAASTSGPPTMLTHSISRLAGSLRRPSAITRK
jgi:hypothetical protein